MRFCESLVERVAVRDLYLKKVDFWRFFAHFRSKWAHFRPNFARFQQRRTRKVVFGLRGVQRRTHESQTVPDTAPERPGTRKHTDKKVHFLVKSYREMKKNFPCGAKRAWGDTPQTPRFYIFTSLKFQLK